MNKSQLLFSSSEVAVLLGLHTDTVYRLITSGQLQQVKIGKLRKVHRDELDRFIADHAVAREGKVTQSVAVS